MRNLKFSVLLVFISFFSLTIIAQTKNVDSILSLNDGTINNQFEYVIKKSNKYQDFKVIKTDWLYTLKAHTLDSLNTFRKNLLNAKAIVDSLTVEVSSLKANLRDSQNDLFKTNEKKNSMHLFGLQMSKANYNLLMLIIIAVLLAFLFIFIYKFKNSNTITKTAKNNLAYIEEEFEEHRRNALVREQKVRRQLQDELNKQKDTS